ncbi:tetratricopeptide repeat protein [Streptomyces sp. NPDC055058]
MPDGDREGPALVLEALAGHLPRYRRSMTAYARLPAAPGPDTAPASGGT